MSTRPRASVSVAADLAITGRIMQIRQMQADLQSRPVTGSFRRLKRLVFNVVRSTFRQQFTLNSATVDLIEALHRELDCRSANSSTLVMNSIETRVPAALRFADSEASIPISAGEVLASCGQTQDQAKLNNIRPLLGFDTVYTSPAEMRMPERVALYSLIFGMQPRNCLEIGTFRGGSSAIICGAMNDTGFGRLTCIDPMPKIDPELWSRLSNRCRLFEGPSPDILAEVAQHIDTPFDFVLIDANHTYEAVRRDISGVLPYLADRAYVLFHDANFPDVKQAIDESVATNLQLTDCGLMSVEPTVLYQNSQRVTWAGLRLIKFQRRVAGVKAA